MRREATAIWIALCLAALTGSSVCAEQQAPGPSAPADELEARALYENMLRSLRSANTLSYESAFRTGPLKNDLDHGTFKVWMKKPNYFRVETRVGDDDRWRGILIGDGQNAWSYWPNGRPFFSGENEALHEQTRFHVYLQEPAPFGEYAIRYSAVMKKSNFFAVLDPSAFQGVKDSLDPLRDGTRGAGVERVGEEDCRVIEISYMDHRRSCYFWISPRDYLPRRLRRVVRGTGDQESFDEEQWSRVVLNAEIPPEKFAWKPPEGWRQWQPPVPEDRLLKPGQAAPDWAFSSLDGRRITLSACRGKIVWLTFWRVQCPPCREEMPYLEKLHQRYGDQGLVVLGFDFADDVKSAAGFLAEHAVTFPCIVDSSDEAIKTGFFTYGARAAPVNYIIDRDGRIAAAWLGYDKGSRQGLETLGTLGLNVAP